MEKIIFVDEEVSLETPISAENLNAIQNNIENEIDKKEDKLIVAQDLNNFKNEITEKENKNTNDLSEIKKNIGNKEFKAVIASFANNQNLNCIINSVSQLKNGNIYFIYFKNERIETTPPKLSVDGGKNFYNIMDTENNVKWETIKGTARVIYYNNNNFYIMKEEERKIGVYQVGYAVANDDIPFKKLAINIGNMEQYFKLERGKLIVLKEKLKLKISCNIYIDNHAGKDAGYIWLRIYKNRTTIAGSITSNYGRYTSIVLPSNIYEVSQGDIININLNNSKETLGYTLDDLDRSSFNIEVIE